MKLIIVESPTKAKTIQGFLDSSYKVVSSKGHIVDLPPKSFGVSIKNDFTPRYVVLKENVAKYLKKEAREANLIILATDPDREGEAIGYHIKELLGKDAKRALFYEVTKDAVIKALQNLGSIDMMKVEAQHARRILDRIVGYDVSPLLWDVFHKQDLSAGRVQSVALRLICEREEEIRNFKPQEYWEIKCKFDGKPKFTAKLEKIKPKSEKEAKEVEEDLRKQNFIVKAFKKKDTTKKPLPPYITSTLQQDASFRLNFSTKLTMQVAQQLFEGIEISGKKRVGFITYMRTDSLRVASHAIKEAKEYISKEIGKEYLPPKPRKYGKDEGAHEAIRPTSVKRTPESVKQNLTPKQFKLYSLIWRRFVASQMANAVYEYKKIDIKGGKYNLTKETENLKFDGFTKVYYTEHKKEEDIPELPKGTKLTLLDIIKEQKFTQPKPRYTEGKMVKELESKGIGRPSTYAPIISRIIEKEYVKKVKGRLVPTELGEGVNKILVSRFPDIFNVDFTRKMEEDLDKIETAKIDRVSVLKSFYEPFRQSMLKFFKEKKVIRKELTEVTEERCELCGKPMLIKWGRHGKFLACSGFPECKNAKPLETDRTQEACPKCNATLVKRKGKYGEFLACPNYPNCKFTKPISVGISCPECGNELVQRKTKKGRTFYGCTNYPKCEFAIWYKPVNKKCSSCGYPIMVERRGKLGCLKCKNIED